MAIITTTSELHTSKEVAAILDQPWSRVRWILNSRSIPAVTRVGITWLYDNTAVELVRKEIEAMSTRRSTVPAELPP